MVTKAMDEACTDTNAYFLTEFINNRTNDSVTNVGNDLHLTPGDGCYSSGAVAVNAEGQFRKEEA